MATQLNTLELRLATTGLPPAEAALLRLQSGLQATHAAARGTNQTLGKFNTTITRTNQVMSGLGLVNVAGSLGLVGNAAIAATSAVQGLTAAMSSLTSVKGGLAAIAIAMTAITAFQGFQTFRARRGAADAEAKLGEEVQNRAVSLSNAITKLGESGKLTADEMRRLNAEIDRALDMPPGDASTILSGVFRKVHPMMPTEKAFEMEKKMLELKGDQKRLAIEEVQFRLSETKNLRERNALLEVYLTELKEIIEARQSASTEAFRQGVITEADNLQEQAKAAKELLEVERERARLRGESHDQLAGLVNRGQEHKDRRSLDVQITSAFETLQNQFGTTAEMIARGFTTIIGSAVEGIAGSIRGLLTLTMSWGESLRNIGLSIVNGLINAFAQMVAEWILSHVIMKGVMLVFSAFGIGLKAKETLATQGIEASKTPLLAVNAGLASTSSYGAAAAIGLAAVIALIAALAATSFATGGYTGDGGRLEAAGTVHRREFVLNAETTQRVGVGNLEALQRGESMLDYGSGGVNVAIFDDRAKMREWVQSREGKVAIMDAAYL